MIELDTFGTFPHPKGTPNKLKKKPILFLMPSPAIYQNEFNTYLHFFELDGGCTGHYIEKGNISYLLLKKLKNNYISDISIIAGVIDIFIRSHIPKQKSNKCIENAAEWAENELNDWLQKDEMGKEKVKNGKPEFRSVHIGPCIFKKIPNPLLVKDIYYDWGISYKEKSKDKTSFHITNIDLGEDINKIWFLDIASRKKIKNALLLNERFQKNKLFKEVEKGNLFPIYISPKFLHSLLVHFWIEFRNSSIKDLINAIDNPVNYGISKEINKVRKYLFRIMALENDHAFVSFLIPNLKALYKVINATHQISEFHRIRTIIVTHSFILRPPFLTKGEGDNG